MSFAPSGQAQVLPRPVVEPGEGPRTDYRDEDWQFWWFLHAEPLLEARRRQLSGEDVTERSRLSDDERTHVRSALVAALEEGGPDLRAAALVALGRLGDRELLPLLVASLDDSVHEVRRAAARAIGILGDPAAVPLLAELVRDDEREGPLRQDAAVALGLIHADAEVADPAENNEATDAAIPWIGHDGGVVDLVRVAGSHLSAGRDGRIRHHTASPDGSVSHVLFEGDSPVLDFASAPAGDRIAVVSDGSVVVVTTADGRMRTIDTAPDAAVVAWDRERAERIAIGHADGSLTVARTSTGKTLATAAATGDAIVAAAWPAGVEKIALATRGGSVRVVFARTGRTLAETKTHVGAITALHWPSGDEEILTCGSDGRVAATSPRPEETPRPIIELETPLLCLARRSSPDLLAAGADDGTVRLIDPALGVETARLPGPGGPVTAIRFNADGTALTVGTADGHLAQLALPAGTSRPPTADGAPVHLPEDARSSVLAALLDPKEFLELDSRAQTGVAIGAGVSRDPALGPFIQGLLRRKIAVNQVIRGDLVTALARVGDAERREPLLDHLDDDTAHLRRAAALGVGALFADADEPDLLKRLRSRQRKEGDVTIRNFLSIAMGRIGGRYGVGPLLDELSESHAGTFSQYGVATAPRIRFGARSRLSFAALGIGLAQDVRGLGALVDRFTDESVVSTRAALALAIGLSGDARAAKTLRSTFRTKKDPILRSYLALALGLLGDDTYRDRFVQVLEREIDDELLLRTALAMHLMSDRLGERTLLERLDRERRPGARRAVLYALARTAHAPAISPLLQILTDPRESEFVRRYAAIALGHIGSGRFVSRWSAVGEHAPYPAEATRLLDLYALP